MKTTISHHGHAVTAAQLNSLDFFAGGVPAGAVFQLSAGEMKRLLAAKPQGAIGRTLEQVCFIGLVSYFEAFCRDCFASLINICPTLLLRLKSRGHDVSIDSLAALEMADALRFKIGFLVSERFDFGNARKINALYSALLEITPFAKAEMKVFDKILSDRNLLVHHGGIFIHSYFSQRIGLPADTSRPFMDSLLVDQAYVASQLNFLYRVAKKIVNTSHAAVTKQIASGEMSIDACAEGALKMFNWWDKE